MTWLFSHSTTSGAEARLLCSLRLSEGTTMQDKEEEETQFLLEHELEPPRRPLDLGQLGLLCYARLLESWVYWTVFPFLPAQVERAGVEPAAAGYYTGIIESIFSVTQFIFILFCWNSLADRLGRKPVLLICLTGLSASAALFGFATTIWQMILLRSIGGIFAASLVIIRIMIVEISTKETQAMAFAWFAGVNSLGNTLAPMSGGLLQDPANQYRCLSGILIFLDYPFLLPCLFAAGIGASACILCLFYLKETRPMQKAATDGGGSHWTFGRLFSVPAINYILLLNGALSALSHGYGAISPVSWYTPVLQGGLGMSTRNMGIYMATIGASQGVGMLLVFPRLHSRIGTWGVIHLGLLAYGLTCSLQIAMNMLAKAHLAALYTLGLALTLLSAPIMALRHTALQLAINDSCPEPDALARVISVCMCIDSAVRAIAPSTWSALFAFGVENQILNGHLAWYTILACTGVMVIVVGHPGIVKPVTGLVQHFRR